MMHKLNSLGLLSYTNTNQLEIQENEVQKVTSVTSAKESFSPNQGSIELTSSKVDNIERLGIIIDNIPHPCMAITLSHNPTQLFVLSRIYVHEILLGHVYLDNSVLQIWSL